ncbi:ribonuclease Z [Celerinatantimonas sp. YJH-8]|uniref:ribonuclease Z n=1 Tax=Celerinatantimonas sp. YJH-8 TaxID=3228714 RepID=UPI0038BF99FA
MDLLFLGTSAGVPTKTRNVSGSVIREAFGKGWYLIDCGEATQHQLLHTKLSLNTLKAIFITHIHGDHCYGLLGLLASAAMNGRTDPLKIIAPKGIAEWVMATQRYTQLYIPYELEFICSDTFPYLKFEAMTVTCQPLSHRVPSYAYCFQERDIKPGLNIEKLQQDGIPKGPLWGKISQGEDVEYQGQRFCGRDYWVFAHAPRKIVIAGDNDMPSLLTECCQDCQVLVHEATYTRDVALKVGKAFGHSDAHTIATFAEQCQLPYLVLTHFSPRYQNHSTSLLSIADIQEEARNVYSGQLYLAYDLAEFHLDRAGRLQVVGEGFQ